MKERLLEIAETAVKMAEKLGASQAEAYVGQSRAFAIEAENSAIRNAEEKNDAGIGIRSVIDKGIGFAFVTTLSDDDVREAVTRSVKLAKVSIPDPDFVSLPSDDNSYPTVKGLFDKNIAELPSEVTADMIIRVVDASKEVLEGRDYAISAGVQSSSVFRPLRRGPLSSYTLLLSSKKQMTKLKVTTISFLEIWMRLTQKR